MVASFNQRLKHFLTSKEISHEFFAKKVGVSRSSVYQWTSGETEPAAAKKLLILKLYPKLSPTWLLFGRGEMTVEGVKVMAADFQDMVNESHPLYGFVSNHLKDADKASELLIQAKDDLIENLIKRIELLEAVLDDKKKEIERLS